ncbi:forespore capture DNA-binding protein RefZ [Niallia sp. FSL W8-0635]|uniref:forespore capture DNA-binding protein RefZ n=1 Tax=Niallia sp. FSL W8-0635 TaxID=2975337 RepID=UPI0009D33281|nr:regulatory protein [Mycobacteroides abscessus subsp. abscessus]HEO8420045.1 forespore capture DNA-binding protein RefZ [Yersinia enterocolitica]
MKEISTREAIVEAAISLFNQKGYHGTSIRDIAGLANVNTANISYYFNGKQGLLEYCYMNFFENYLEQLEHVFIQSVSPREKLKKMVNCIITYQCSNPQLTRFILREVTIDSQVVREIMSTYYVKERYIFTQIFEKGIERKEFRKQSISYSIIQLKGLLSMPFIHSFYLTEVLHVFLNEEYFKRKYLEEIHLWIDDVVCLNEKELSIIP